MSVERVLIVVETYPHPSRSYQELVCTAGMLEDGTFVRFYPIDYRYRPSHQKYKKYQWIEVDINKANDFRPESYRPNLDSIRLIGEPLSTGNCWSERKKTVLAKPLKTMCELRKDYDDNHTSLGIIRPNNIVEMQVKAVDREWKQSHQAALAQFSLFAQEKKPLKKIPYEFSYHFFCDKSCKGHTMLITDWELGVLFLKEVQRLGSEEDAIESIKQKFYDDLCSFDKDTHFFVGTTLPYNSWIVLGVFYPKKVTELPPIKQISMEF